MIFDTSQWLALAIVREIANLVEPDTGQELIVDCLAQRSLAQEDFVEHRYQLVLHILLDLGDQLYPLQSRANSSFEMKPRSPKSFPKRRRASRGAGFRSSTFPGVIITASKSPQSLITR